jgi:hypothetical protein
MVTQIQKSESEMNNYNEDSAYWYKLYADRKKGIYDTETEVARLARDAAPVISAHGAQIERTFIFPWHRSIIRAKQDYLNHNDAWVKSLSADTVIDEKFGDARLSQEIRNTWEISKFSLPDAIPILDLYSLESKINNIFKD